MTKREQMGTTNLDMTSPLGWRQRVLLMTLRDLHRQDLISDTKHVVQIAYHMAVTYGNGDKSDLRDYDWYVDNNEGTSHSWFYRDCADTLSIMRRKGWISKVGDQWIIEKKFVEKVDALKYEQFTMISTGRR